MSKFDLIAEQASLPDPDFEAFFAECERRVPGLAGNSRQLRLEREGFKRALRLAYAAGKFSHAQAVVDINPEDLLSL